MLQDALLLCRTGVDRIAGGDFSGERLATLHRALISQYFEECAEEQDEGSRGDAGDRTAAVYRWHAWGREAVHEDGNVPKDAEKNTKMEQT